MEELELDRINANSPYIVELDFSTGLFKFVSDFGVSFSVAFEKDELLQSGESYQFALTNYEGTKSPRDSKVRETVMCIVDEFFRKNQAALLYICETGDGMQKMRRIVVEKLGLIFLVETYRHNSDSCQLPFVHMTEILNRVHFIAIAAIPVLIGSVVGKQAHHTERTAGR